MQAFVRLRAAADGVDQTADADCHVRWRQSLKATGDSDHWRPNHLNAADAADIACVVDWFEREHRLVGPGETP